MGSSGMVLVVQLQRRRPLTKSTTDAARTTTGPRLAHRMVQGIQLV